MVYNESVKIDTKLDFHQDYQQKINLSGSSNGIGFQKDTVFFHSNQNFAWYKGGTPGTGELDLGTASCQMSINDWGYLGIGTNYPNARLDVRGDAKITSDLDVSGDAYIDSKLGIGTTSPSAKLEVNGRIKDKTGFVIPVGTIVAYAGKDDPPDGWLWCDGSSFNTTQYSELYNVLNKSTVPNLQGRFIIGSGSFNSYSYQLHETGGEEKHQLTIDEMPSHNHEYDSYYKYLVRKGLHTSNSKTDDSPDEINLFMAYPIQSVGCNEYHENRPPYYALKYIIKT
ncbi:tail fiber protein [Moorena sp. SIO4G3]|uniref:tail fiber protein n=1 Tax=Moorena sp. SIO4G3 TaxID=2607821 RepID=UPI00142A9E63|nr:tail fiber protein [Moorena sp. SIO4G3]NEO80119.1 hypothetical protein [Moorena sp. SIO4G3]